MENMPKAIGLNPAPSWFAGWFFKGPYASVIQDHLRDYYSDFFDYLMQHEQMLDFVYQLQSIMQDFAEDLLAALIEEYKVSEGKVSYSLELPGINADDIAASREGYVSLLYRIRLASAFEEKVRQETLGRFLYNLFPLPEGIKPKTQRYDNIALISELDMAKLGGGEDN